MKIFGQCFRRSERLELNSASCGKANSMSLQDQCAVVTGGTSGIGYAVVAQLMAAGARVLCADCDPVALEKVRHAFPDVFTFEVDITDPDRVEAMADQAVATMGGLSILVHSAGIGVERCFLETPLAE
jgi:sorbitol-6-phosphate 2-dehydrogenase